MKRQLIDFFLEWWKSGLTDEQFANDNDLSVEDLGKLIHMGAMYYLEAD